MQVSAATFSADFQPLYRCTLFTSSSIIHAIEMNIDNLRRKNELCQVAATGSIVMPDNDVRHKVRVDVGNVSAGV